MKYKSLLEAKKALSGYPDTFYLDNRVYEGFEENNKTYLIIDNKPVETHSKHGFIRKDRGQAFFEPTIKMAVDIDSRDGFLYQQDDINYLHLLKSNEDFEIEGDDRIFKAGNIYIANKKGEIEKYSEDRFENLKEYDFATFTKNDVKNERAIILKLSKKQNEEIASDYSRLLKEKSSIRSIKLKRNQ